ncbi:putative Ig domain-containing protein [Belnapia sp. F-4-1]|uniref:putative Ig domain-containing protein n=2 Tax=Belnapia sp. F-4-1 TaxID=1545443 RepID=UPI0005B92A43|nr:putative Ig domain-containing protein [Belnapia sp. F-4-1]
MAGIRIQAETGAITLASSADSDSTQVRNAGNREGTTGLPNGLRPGYTGTGYLDFGNDAGDRVTYTFEVETAGQYTVNIRYASSPFSGNPRALALAVNSGTPTSVTFPNTGGSTGELQGFNVWGTLTQTVTLQAGTNTLSFAIPPGATSGPNLDIIEIISPGTAPDTVADADNNLAFSGPTAPLEKAAAASIALNVAGRDDDIYKAEISFDGGTTRTTVYPDAQGNFVFNGSALPFGTSTATLIVTDIAGNEARAATSVTIGGTIGSPSPLIIQAEDFTINDTTGTGSALTQARKPGAPGTGLTPPLRDVNRDGLWDGFTGSGYMDMGGNSGDAVSFAVNIPTAGTYTLAFRYSNGGGGDNAPRPMTLTAGGQTQTIAFTGTGVDGWDNWATATVTVQLAAGRNTISLANTIANGPNIDSVTITAPIEQEPENTAPVLVGDGIADADAVEGVPFSLDLATRFSDADGESLSFTATGLPSWLTLGANGLLTGTPPNDAAGTPLTITVTATDAAGAEVDDTFQITVTEADENAPPVLAAAIADQTGQVGEALSFTLPAGTFTDPDNDALAFTLTGLPQGVTYDAATRTLSGTPTAAGTYQLTVTATDTAGATATDTFNLIIEPEEEEPENAAPVQAAAIADQGGKVGEALNFTLPSDAFTDPDNDTLTLTVDTLPDGLDFDTATRTLSGTPTAAGTYQVTVTATDTAGASVSGTFDLIIAPEDEEPENTAPVLVGDGIADADAVEGVPFSLDLATRFSDADGESLSFTATGLPSWLTLGANGLLTGTPPNDAAGTPLTITVTATDAAGAEVDDTFQIMVTEADENAPPVLAAAIADQTGQVGEALSFTLPAGTFTDPDNDALAFTLTGLPQGVTYDAATRTLSGTPIAAGTYQLTVTATDTAGATATDTFALIITPEGQAPAAPVRIEAEAFERRTGFTSEAITGASGGQVIRLPSRQNGATSTDLADVGVTAGTYDVRIAYLDENDSNIGASLYVDGIKVGDWRFDQATPGNGAQIGNLREVTFANVTVGANSVLELRATSDNLEFARIDYVKLTPKPASEEPENAAPVVADDIADQTGQVGEALSFVLPTGTFTDPDGDALAFTLTGLPQGVTYDAATRTLSGTPTTAGTYQLTVTATDTAGATATDTFALIISAEEEEPAAPILIQAESGSIALATAADGQSTQVRDPSNRESNPDLPNGLRPGFTGTGYLDFGNDGGDRVTYTVQVETAGAYTLSVRYASAPFNGADRSLAISVNNGTPTTVPFPSTGPGTGPVAEQGFNVWGTLTQTVTLQAGANTISFAIPAGATSGPNLDSIEIAPVGTPTDTTADADNNLFLSGPDEPLNQTGAASINFNVAGRDADIVKTEVSFDGGATRTTVLPDADGDFVFNGSALPAGTRTATVIVTDAAGNEAEATTSVIIGGTTGTPFQLTIQAETFVISDNTGTGAALTQKREVGNTGTGFTAPSRDVNGDGLWDGITGSGYMDMGGNAGDAVSFGVTAPTAGTYTLSFRYSNGSNDSAARPMTLNVGGQTQTIAFTSTGVDGWDNWATATVTVQLAAGQNTISLANNGTSGPNIDSVTIASEGTTPVDTRDQLTFEPVVKINFQPAPGQTSNGLPAGYVTPAGYLADTGAGFGDRGNGFSYGWVTEASVADGTANGTIAAAQPANAHWYKGTVANASDLQKTYAHFEYPGAPAGTARAWEMALANGTYQVKMSIGDTAGAFDSTYRVNLEGVRTGADWVPANPGGNGAQTGGGFRSTLVTRIVQVTDGRLTIDSIGGTNTEIQYLEIERVPDLTPQDTRTADLDYSFFVAPVASYLNEQVSIAIGENGSLPTGINPNSALVVGVNVQAPDHRGPNIAHVDNVKLVETLTGQQVAVTVQISGGADSLTIRPTQPLKENTSYTLKVEDVLDLGGIENPTAPLHQMQDLTTTFVTGTAPVETAREVAFTTQTLLDGFADGAGGFTTVEFGPDGKLYVATITGEIYRWAVNSDGSINNGSKESLVLDHFSQGAAGRRGIIGFTFDPENPNTIWVTDNYPIPRENKAFDTPEFSGRISKITLGTNGSFTGATAQAYVTGLPRSGGDHVTNSLEFRANPNAGAAGEPAYLLYLSQGSNSAAGSPDGAWGNRPERLLNAAVLEIDPRRSAPSGGFDVRTEPVSAPTTTNPASSFNANGTYQGFYNPFAPDAVLKIFATGIRNAYDLVWHSNGQLYAPTNGTASGGRTPDDPAQTGSQIISNSPKQYDYLFTVEEGKYYGHPNPLRGTYVLNGGNPTGGIDPNEVTDRKDGNPNTDGYDVGVLPDENYDLDGTYNLGYNQSPNGATEYKGNAFGANLKGAILIAQFSTGDNVRVIRVGSDGKIVGDDVLRRPDGSIIDDYIDPLDIIENPVTGQLYLMTLNRGTGASQLVLLTPAPGGVTQDVTADEGGNLAIAVANASNPAAVVFQVSGLDTDITALRVRIGTGPQQTVTLDANNRFTLDLSTQSGPVAVQLEVTDDAQNRATTTATFTPGGTPGGGTGDLVSLAVVQAEDVTPNNGTSVSVSTGGAAQIQIRTTANPESGNDLVGGLRPGAFGLDGNTVNTDGVAGGYADYGATIGDLLTFNVNVPEDQVGSGLIRVRYGNGGTADRPLQVLVNGASVGTFGFSPPPGVTGVAAWSTWQVIEIPANLIAGTNVITFRQTTAAGPNIDQIEVLAPQPAAPGGQTYAYYEAEAAALSGAVVITQDRNQEGTGFVDFDGSGDQSITWTVNSAAAGSFEIAFRYALATSKGDRPLTLTVNGVNLGPLSFPGFSNAAEDQWQFQTTMVNLVAGANTIRLTAPNAVGPNIDQLRVATGASSGPFAPDYVAVEGDTRIQLEQTADDSTRILNSQNVEFYFTVDEDGLYAFDLAANAGALNGQGLNLYLNGALVENMAFPTAGEQTVFLELDAGTQYQLRVVSNAPGANAIDYLDIRPMAANPNADIAVQSLDPAYFDNRLHFSYLENPNGSAPNRDFKESGTVRISNTGTEALSVLGAEINGPFVLANPAVFNGLTLAAGQSIDVTVLFNRAAYTPPTSNVDATSTVFEGSIRLITNDADSPVATIDLAGFWQSRDEGGQEPNVNEVWKVFGFGNVIEGLTTSGGGENSTLNDFDLYRSADATEVLSPYWRIADGVTQVKVTHIAAFHGPSGATFQIHNPGNKGQNVELWDHGSTQNQTILPLVSGTNFATAFFNAARIPDSWMGNDIFGMSIAGLSTDPRLNPEGGGTPPAGTENLERGYTHRIFQAVDKAGNIIPNVYLGIMDYTGINYDYNDNMVVIEGIAPVGFGQVLSVTGLDDAAADQRLVFTNIDTPANASQAFRNEAVITLRNDGFTALNITGITVADTSAFQIVGTVPTTINPGSTANVTVRFIGTHAGTTAGAQLYESTLTIQSNDSVNGPRVITLAGLAQEFSERDSEPTVAQIVDAFGYGTDMAQGELAGGGVVETVGDEVLLPYMQRLDTTRPIEVIQLAAFLTQGNVARIGFHGLQSAQVTPLFANDDQQGQTVLPDALVPGAGAGANVARATINQNGPFGLYISVDGRPTYSSWSDPKINNVDPNIGQLVGDNQGHLIRFFQALDASGKVIPGTYIGIQDYPGAGNYDYNDHMFVIKNVQGYSPAGREDANSDGVIDALQADADNDGTLNFFDVTAGNPPTGNQTPFGGTAPSFVNNALTVDASNYDQGGQGIAFNDNAGKAGGNATFRPGDGVETVGAENDIGYVLPGEWVEYTINVPQAGTYRLSLNAKTPLANATVAVSLGQAAPLATVALQDGGTNFGTAPFQASAPVDLTLPAGQQTIRLTFGGTPQADSPYLLDLRSFTFNYVQAPPAGGQQSPFGGTAVAIGAAPVTIGAAQFDLGGQGVAFNDTTPNLDEGGTAGRNEGADVVGNNQALGWINNGEWVEYTVNVQQAGRYDLVMRTATPDPGRTITASFEQGGTVYRTSSAIALADTNSYTVFADSQAAQLDLNAGVQTIRLTFNGGAFDLQSFTLDRANTAPVAAQPLAGQAATQGQAFTYALPAGTFTDADGDALTYSATGLPQGLTISTAGVITGTPAAAGTYTIGVIASDGTANATANLALTVAPSTPTPTNQTPFGGIPIAVGVSPISIVATQFDLGGQGVAFNDTTPNTDQGGTAGRNEGVDVVGNNQAIGWITNGEWVEYTVNVQQAGRYNLAFNAATLDPGRTITASSERNGTVYETSNTVAVVDTNSYTAFALTQAAQLDLEAGVQTVRLTFNGGPLDLQSFNFAFAPPDGQGPFSGTPAVIGAAAVVINATQFDVGGQGVAFSDTTPNLDEGGTAGRNEGVDVVGNNQAIGWVSNNEWVEYTVNVQQAGRYALSFSTATPDPGRSISASFTQNGTIYETSGAVAVPDTNSYTTFATGQTVQVDLNAGVQTIRLTFNGGPFDLQSFRLAQTAAAPATLRSFAAEEGFTFDAFAARQAPVTMLAEPQGPDSVLELEATAETTALPEAPATLPILVLDEAEPRGFEVT